ncbi:hypothetical protein RU820_06105 [Acidithiobacillus ferrooxidans]|uniref:Uncharacterized protein n=1 Tax=Acidithiobacillus ferrooxidans (strain ATCC 23270 / DSM 14882 / CIP 104768 / NCIMB 8455) TaxID=243159 RepID=B7J8W4_ACIF2|nr:MULTISPECIES: hypothetical protein [Acidithiobacillus]ACK78492.1 hypothetical protein AFE_1282 [Acidithiobacillus ferrooxidans ATCC 23270]MBN6744326.1 hypothetical protein [Acidithiobacillus sp. MC2.2]MBN6747285.1 hypothetical protein [Acidithiobacillus sp. PG05]
MSQEELRKQLLAMREQGLKFTDCVHVFGVPVDTNTYALAAKARADESFDTMALDDDVVIADTTGGAWVSCWIRIEDKDASEYRNTHLLMTVDLDERGVFKAHVDDMDGNTILTMSNEEEEDGELSFVRDGFIKHPRDTDGLLVYLKEMGMAPESASLEIQG